MPFWLIATYVVLWAAGMGLGITYRRRIRQQYPELGARLFPSLAQKSMASDLAGLAFLLRGDFRKLDDPEFVRMSETYRGMLLAFFAVFVVTFVVFFVTR